MKVAVIDSNASNTQSVVYALKRMGIEPIVTYDISILQSADKVIFPGVGAAQTAMNFLQKHQLDQFLIDTTRPVLGICLGMQLMCTYSEENDTNCLNIFPHKVVKFKAESKKKIPHMGWNQVSNLIGPLFKNVKNGSYLYFVHSFYLGITDETCAVTDYFQKFCAACQKDNFYAVQFHPEKSGKVGQTILENFIQL